MRYNANNLMKIKSIHIYVDGHRSEITRLHDTYTYNRRLLPRLSQYRWELRSILVICYCYMHGGLSMGKVDENGEPPTHRKQ